MIRLAEEKPARSVYICIRISRPKVDPVKAGGVSTESKLTKPIPLPDQTSGTRPRQPHLSLELEVGNPRVRDPRSFIHRL